MYESDKEDLSYETIYKTSIDDTPLLDQPNDSILQYLCYCCCCFRLST